MKKHPIILIIFFVTPLLLLSCRLQNNAEVDYVVALKDNYWGIIISIIGVLLGAIIGGLITLWVSLKIQKRERAIIYAQKNRKEIYEPLYEEIIIKHEQFNNYIDPFGPSDHLIAWGKFTESMKFRIPNKLKELHEQFEINAKK